MGWGWGAMGYSWVLRGGVREGEGVLEWCEVGWRGAARGVYES